MDKMENPDEIGTNAMHKMMINDYSDAVRILTEGIKMYPSEHRFYTNRCNCYLTMKAYNEALMDAIYLTENYPKYPKGYFLRGEIAFEKKNYKEAEKHYLKVRSMTQSCEAERKLFESQLQQLLAKGHERELANKAMRLSSSVGEALNYLSLGMVKKNKEETSSYYMPLTDEEETFLLKAFERFESSGSVAAQPKPKPKTKFVVRDQASKDPLTDTSNPLKCNSLFIGNVSDSVTEKKLWQTFMKYGEVESVFVQHDKKCGFINFRKPEQAAHAMKEMQGKNLENIPIFIRFPNNALKKK